ncbi:serine protease nudel isoform X2 [Anastrepha ludens]|uniref:serine protease nudel isoform X2 n=1 Tax=Anastrepha ludens TaxID=28586 RepID=UPI0023AFC53E|nr:serine protease nudel isoform X2 [Anastrepha ludens]
MMAKIKRLSEVDNEVFGTRTQRKSLRTALTRTLAVSGVMLLLLTTILIYHSIAPNRIDKLHEAEVLSFLKAKQYSSQSDHIPPNEGVVIAIDQVSAHDDIPVSQYDQSLDIQHLRSKIVRHRYARALPDMLDPVFLQHEPDFNSLYTKVRNKRTRLELGKLEKEYLRCKKESINSSGCMVAFMRLYNLAKDISDKMDKMKEIFNDNEEVLQRSASSASDESKKLSDKQMQTHGEGSIQNKEISEHFVRSTTETSFSAAAEEESGNNSSFSTNVDDKHIHYSWIIDGPDDGIQEKVSVQENTAATTPGIRPVTKIESMTTSLPYTPELKKIQNDTKSIPTKNYSHKISWILDGYENDGETTMPKDRPLMPETTERPEHTFSSTTKSSASMEIMSIGTEKVSWILDEFENAETQKPEKISWIIDGNDDNDTVATSTSRITSTSTRDVFEELENITEGVEKEEDRLRKLKNDAISDEEKDDSKDGYGRVVSITSGPITQSTAVLVMNETVIFTNTSDVIITYGGVCAATPRTMLDREKAHTGAKYSSHPLDYPTSEENMVEERERQYSYKAAKRPTVSPYDAKMWEELFRKGAIVPDQQGELIDNFDAGDMKTFTSFGAKVNSANLNHSPDAQFLTLCDQVAKRLRNKNTNTESERFTPAPGQRFTSRGPGGFPVTGETMKATAQFLYNPNFGMPTIPICFYITPANFRMANQSPMWTPNYSNMASSFASGPMGFNVPNGIFFVPQNFGPTGNFFRQSGGTGAGGQSNIPKAFTNTASPRKQQQQFFCTYVQNNAENNNSGINPDGPDSGLNTMTFSNSNFKMRSSAQNLSQDIIYASYTNFPDHLGRVDNFKCESADDTSCYSGKECIRVSSWCDGYVDCSDGSDEAACRCIDRLTSNRICDGYADCPMGEDELGCFGCNDAVFSCYDSPEEYIAFNRSTVSMCYSATEKCDGVMNCLNGRDELECNVIVKDVMDHMSHTVSSSSGFLFHNYRGEWFPVCNNAQKWAQAACANEADHNAKANVTFREIVLHRPFIEPTLIGQVHFPSSCQQQDAHDKLIDKAAYVTCSQTKCGSVKKKIKTPFRRKRSKRNLLSDRRKVKNPQQLEASNGRIVGGRFSTPMQWPFVVAVYRDGKFHCAGTIYSERWIISAAHCVLNYHNYYYEIHAGMIRRLSFSSTTQIRAVSHVVVHQAYERRSMRNDLAMLRMREPLMFNRWVKPICMPDIGRTTAGEDWIWGPEENTLCTVVGWGAMREKGPGSDQLREVMVPIRKQCTELEDKYSENVCAGDVDGGRDACQGDSGGPLFCRSVNNTEEWYLAGVVSHGNGCARPGEVGAYSRVALYLDWIALAVKFPSKIQPRSMCPGYTCVWGGKRCISKKLRCNRVVDCLGGEDEVGCTYNFAPDMVSGTNVLSTTTESDYYPENVMTSPPCRAEDTARNVHIENEDEEERNKTSKNRFTTTEAGKTSTVVSTEMSTKRMRTTEINSMRTTTETSSSNEMTTVSLTPFDVENLVTTTAIDSMLSSTTKQNASPDQETSTDTNTKNFTNSSIPGKFVCQRISQIVELKNRCDRVMDCEDGTDEDDCSCRDFLKGSLSILICDGKTDCEDLTDEENCGNCTADEFLCPLSQMCVPMQKRCDGIVECDFHEDERDCFALTNGREIVLDVDRRPVLNSAGIFSRNSNGKWSVVCSHEMPLSKQIAETASNVCTQLGFKSLKFYNTTHPITHNIIVPIHPDIYKKKLHSQLSALSSVERHFRVDELAFKARIQYVEHINDECLGIFVECEAKSNNVEPIKTVSAGELRPPEAVPSSVLQPALETHGKPNVFATPPSTTVLWKKKDELLHKLDGIIENRKNMSLLIDNKLHEAIEDLHWPWVVDVYVDGRLWCVGALVDKHWVLVHDTCHYGVRFNTHYIAVLLGGGKTKHLRHKSVHEQIRRVDNFEQVPKSNVLLYHLEKPVHFTYHVLPTFFPDFSNHTTAQYPQCIAILHDDHSGRIKAVSAIEEQNDELCKASDMSCYRLVERKPPTKLLNVLDVSEEDFSSLSEEIMLKEAFEETSDTLGSSMSRFTTCTQFGKKNISRTTFEPVDQGILACKQTDTGWYPIALFDYNNTNCYSFKDSFALRTLEKVYGAIQSLIDQPKCEYSYAPPVCSTLRCMLGECLEEEQICNGLSDCHDGADEEKQMCIGRQKVCQASELKCRSTYKCVPKTKFCDHIADCDDMTDEPTLCSCYTYLQATDPKKLCDGVRNCWDKSDESPALCNCTDEHFQCGTSSKECVPRDFVCDKEPDCSNGEDEKYCIGLEFPQQIVNEKTGFTKSPQIKYKQLPQYGQVIEQTYGVWHTKCFPRSNPPDVKDVREICKKLGFNPYKLPSYRIIDDAAQKVAATNEWPDQRGRSFGNDDESPLMERYRSATKAVVVNKFSPLTLNDELTLFLKPSRPIAEVERWNATDSEMCFRLEIKCM